MMERDQTIQELRETIEVFNIVYHHYLDIGVKNQ